MPSLHIVFASTSGHTEYAIGVLADFLKEQRKDLVLSKSRAEQSDIEDLQRGDALLLASGSWNTGGVEGQLNPYMHRLLKEQAKECDLKGKPATFVALGDERYHYTAESGRHMQEWIQHHYGSLLLPGLRIVNEPYGQEERITAWGKELLNALKKVESASPTL